MAAAPPIGPPDDGGGGSVDADLAASYGLFADVRAVRAHVQDFERSLDVLSAACAAAAAAGDDTVVHAAIAAEEPNFLRLKEQIEATLADIAYALRDSPRLRADVSDEVTHISNLWNRVICDWPAAGTGREDVEKRLQHVRGFVRQILVHAARLTAADRLNRHLDTVRIGKTASFDSVFADEIPDPEDRRALLAYLSEHPGAVHGIIDTGRGLVFRTSQSVKVRVATYLTPLAAVAAGAAAVYLAGNLDNWLDLPDWPAGSATTERSSSPTSSSCSGPWSTSGSRRSSSSGSEPERAFSHSTTSSTGCTSATSRSRRASSGCSSACSASVRP